MFSCVKDEHTPCQLNIMAEMINNYCIPHLDVTKENNTEQTLT